MPDENKAAFYQEWAHAPSHLFIPGSAYIVTAGTYSKALYFDTADKRDFLLESLFEEARAWNWNLEAWAVMANLYHFVARAPEDAKSLQRMIGALHSKTAIELNKRDETPGRKVWFQYRDTCLTNERSYFARLNYVHHNPVKHGIVREAVAYRWCSMAWFRKRSAAWDSPDGALTSFDRVKIDDDF